MTSQNMDEELPVNIEYFVICLTQKPERLARVQALRETLPSLHIIDATDGRLLTSADFKQLSESGFVTRHPNTGKHSDFFVYDHRDITVGNVGSFLSHLAAIKAVSALPPGSYGVILEDDILLLPDFISTIHRVSKQLKRYELDGSQIDMVNMYLYDTQRPAIASSTCETIHDPDSKLDGPDITLMRTIEGLWGLQCYIVPTDRASIVIASVWPMRGALDEQITRVGLHSLTLVSPIIICEDDNIVSHTGLLRCTVDDMLAANDG